MTTEDRELHRISHSDQLRDIGQGIVNALKETAGERIAQNWNLRLQVIADEIDAGTVTRRAWTVDRLRQEFGERWTFYEPPDYAALKQRGVTVIHSCVIHALLEGAHHEDLQTPAGQVVLAAAPISPAAPLSAAYERFASFLRTVQNTVDLNGGVWPRQLPEETHGAQA